MNRIRLLPEQVANQIAAGEVIERPASVVKELVENALDAGATRITVEVQAGGRSLVRVTDDGWGMGRDDALLCLERHATSKIRQAEDLAAIGTLGFRGEALPSIASVSRFTLTTRERQSESGAGDSPATGGQDAHATIEGTQIIVNGGKIVEVKAAGSAPGTSVEVRQLFFNLPARRKFLRTEETEASHIQHYLTLAALAFPEVAFAFHKDGRLVWQLVAQKPGPAVSSRLEALRERFRTLLGEEKLLPVNFSALFDDDASPLDETDIFETASPEEAKSGKPKAEIRIWGLMGAPGVSRATRESQYLFVNRRPVENRGLNYALLEGYHTSLMKGRYPVCCLFLEVNPAVVDVNVHPAKREVKFRREPEIRRLMAQAIRETLLAYHGEEPPAHSPQSPARSPRSAVHGSQSEIHSLQPKVTQAELQAVEKPRPAGGVEPTGGTPVPGMPQFPETLKPVAESPANSPVQQTPLKMGSSPSTISPLPAAPSAALPASPPSSIPHPPSSSAAEPVERITAAHSPQSPTPLLHVPLRLIGVIGRLYVVLESDRGLVLLDQHAAHERILFEQMLNRLEQNGSAPSQKLLLPETIELPARDANFLRDQLAALARLGVGLGEFGERTFLLDALPPFVKVADPRRFVLDLVDELKAAGREVNLARLGEHTIAKTVCRHAVKANDPLAGAELENLIEELRRCAMPYTCPHGRPTLIEMNYRELEKKFGRTQ